jgi:hypothetical protein
MGMTAAAIHIFMAMTDTNKTGEVCSLSVCHSRESGNPRLIKNSFLHFAFKRNNVRGYINIKHGFPFSWE